jgi:hypothetical protein
MAFDTTRVESQDYVQFVAILPSPETINRLPTELALLSVDLASIAITASDHFAAARETSVWQSTEKEMATLHRETMIERTATLRLRGSENQLVDGRGAPDCWMPSHRRAAEGVPSKFSQLTLRLTPILHDAHLGWI